MITVIAKLKVQAGKEAAFQAAAEKMIEYVKANEPATHTYILHRSSTDPTDLMFYEIYADQAALAAHGASAAMKEFFGAVGGLLAGRPEISTYEEIAGKK